MEEQTKMKLATKIVLLSSIAFVIFVILLGVFIFFFGEWYTGLCIFYILVPISVVVLVVAPFVTWIIMRKR